MKQKPIQEILNPGELREYLSLVQVVRTGIRNFVEAGRALTIIRDKRLYRERYDSFENFCRAEFHMSKTYASRLISGCETIELLSGSKPSSERVTRELNAVPAETQQGVWDRAKAISGKKEPTAATVKLAILELVPAGRQQKYDKDLLERLRAIQRLVKINTHIEDSSLEVVREALSIMTQVSVILSGIKRALLERNIYLLEEPSMARFELGRGSSSSSK